MKFTIKNRPPYFLAVICCSLLVSLLAWTSTKNFYQIKFGEGGGIVGGRTEYTINSKGEIYKQLPLKSEKQKIGKISGKTLNEIIKKAESVCLSDSIFIKGNHYYFVEIEIKSCNKKFLWSNSNSVQTKNIADFYTFLISIINKK